MQKLEVVSMEFLRAKLPQKGDVCSVFARLILFITFSHRHCCFLCFSSFTRSCFLCFASFYFTLWMEHTCLQKRLQHLPQIISSAILLSATFLNFYGTQMSKQLLFVTSFCQTPLEQRTHPPINLYNELLDKLQYAVFGRRPPLPATALRQRPRDGDFVSCVQACRSVSRG